MSDEFAMLDVLSELTIFGKTIDGGLVDTNIKFRAIVWIGAEILLWSAVAINFINRTFPAFTVRKTAKLQAC